MCILLHLCGYLESYTASEKLCSNFKLNRFDIFFLNTDIVKCVFNLNSPMRLSYSRLWQNAKEYGNYYKSLKVSLNKPCLFTFGKEYVFQACGVCVAQCYHLALRTRVIRMSESCAIRLKVRKLYPTVIFTHMQK